MIGKVVLKALGWVVRTAIGEGIKEGWERYEDGKVGDKGEIPPTTPTPEKIPEKKIEQLHRNLKFRGFSLLQNDPEMNSIARELSEREKNGDFANVFDGRSRELEEKLKHLLQSKMEPINHQEANNLGLKYSSPIGNLFRR